MAHLALGEQCETIQNQAGLKATAEKMETPMKIATLSQITPCNIMQEIYASLKDFENKNIQNQLP